MKRFCKSWLWSGRFLLAVVFGLAALQAQEPPLSPVQSGVKPLQTPPGAKAPKVLERKMLSNKGRAHQKGPEIKNAARRKAVSPRELMSQMLDALEKLWLPAAYEKARFVDLRVRLDADLPLKASQKKLTGKGDLAVDVRIDGIAAPNGRKRLTVNGEFGEMEITNDLRRNLLVSQDFKSFADTPLRSRSKNANLTNYRSFLLRYLGRLREALVQTGTYRAVYVGEGEHEGYLVDIVKIYKPRGKVRKDKRAPVSLDRLWTFWQNGGYEIWIHRTTRMPLVVFYSNTDDNVFANFSIQYDDVWLPARITYNNNSVGADGEGDLVFTFDNQRMLSGLSLRFQGQKGINLSLDASFQFVENVADDAFRIIAPFGFRKLNRDHLNLMLLTQISGNLLKLKKHGVNLKNFKF